MNPADGLPIGEIAALGAAALWAGATILWTRQMAVSRPEAMNLFKTALCLPLFLLAAAIVRGGSPFGGVDTGSAAMLLASGVVGMSIGDTAYFSSLPRIGARRTMMLQTLAPLFAALLALLASQPLPGARGGVGVVLIAVGLILVLRENRAGSKRSGRMASGIFFSVGAAFCQALGIVMTRRGLEGADLLQASAIRMIGGTAGILLIEAIRGQMVVTIRQTLRPPSIPRIVAASLMGTFVAFFLFQVGIRYTAPPVAAALTGTSPLFVAPLSILLLGERMGIGGWVGTLIAVGGVALLML